MTGNGKYINETDIEKFVDEYIDSFIVWDLLLFYFNNPLAVESVSSLANCLGRVDRDVKTCVNSLVKREVLKAADGGTFIYSPSPETAERIKCFNDALAIANLRLTILSQVLSKRKVRPWKQD